MNVIERLDSRPISLTVLAAALILGALILWLVTTWGIGVSTDSTIYLELTRNLISGHGLTIQTGLDTFSPVTHYPPLYPLLLSLWVKLGGDFLAPIRWLHILLLVLNALTAALAVRAFTGSTWLSLLAVGLIVLSPDMLFVHSWALSEALFIFFTTGSLLALNRYVRTNQWQFLMLAASSAAAASLTRYAGLSLIVIGAVYIFISSADRRIRGRIVKSGGFLLIAFGPLMLWIWRNIAVADTATNRTLSFHLIDVAELTNGLLFLARWILPGICILLLLVAMRRRENLTLLPGAISHSGIEALLAFYVVGHFIFLIVSISSIDAHTPLNLRTLSPIVLPSIILFVILGYRFAKPLISIKRNIAVLCLLCATLVVGHAYGAINYVLLSRSAGLGYTGKYWRSLTVLRAVKALQEDKQIYTNGREVVQIFTSAYSTGIPAKIDPGSRRFNANYSQRIAGMARELNEGRAVVIWFDALASKRWYLPNEQELVNDLDLVLLFREHGGSIYAARGSTPEDIFRSRAATTSTPSE